MYTIGITGGTGSGKTSAVQALQALGAQALDCDEIYHEMLLSCAQMKEEIEAHFKGVSTDGKIDRNKLSKIVWNDSASLQELNLITHKYINDEIEQRINAFREQGTKIVAIDAIALIESGQSSRCDIVIGITSPQETRIERIVKRDGLTREQAQMRISAQQHESFYIENCDYILENTYTAQSAFIEKCIEYFRGILKNI